MIFFRRKKINKDYVSKKIDAQKKVRAKVEIFNTFYNFTYKKITVRNQRTRWGSCSKNGGLNFNYRLIYLPEKLLDYVVVHELCHLKEFNHSRRFWDLVFQTIPDYKNRKLELRNILIK